MAASVRQELTNGRHRPPLTAASRWRCGQNCGQAVLLQRLSLASGGADIE